MWKKDIFRRYLFFFCLFPVFSVPAQVKITFTAFPVPGSATKDTVYYSFYRKLIWKDFTGNIRQESSSDAVSFTGFSYDAAVRELKDTVQIKIYLQTYFVKPASWVRPHMKNSYALSHEQSHFDIAKLMEEEFKDSVSNRKFTYTHYGIELQFIYWHFWREMHAIQKKFDDQTHHGNNKTKELVWENKIADRLNYYKQVK